MHSLQPGRATITVENGNFAYAGKRGTWLERSTFLLLDDLERKLA